MVDYMRDVLLDDSEVGTRLQLLEGWVVTQGGLHKEFTFANFKAAFQFMSTVAEAAEKLDHHPDWFNSWNRVVIDITSHARGGITEACFQLAHAAELASKPG